MDITLTWSEFKAVVDSKSLSIQYVDRNGNYYLLAMDSSVQLTCVLDKSSASEFESGYKGSATTYG